MTLSIKKWGICIFYKIRFSAFFVIMKTVANCYQLLQILNDLSIKHLIKLILYENDVKL